MPSASPDSSPAAAVDVTAQEAHSPLGPILRARHEQMQLSTTLASMTEAFATLDSQGRFSFVNPPCNDLLGGQARELLGLPIWGFLEGPDPRNHNPQVRGSNP
ncbi:MAG: PAS domain S-box protein [Betaproteobacteria bacterium]|nr:PAS domain S-box protein [Betaproteobacteria bacterium]